MEPNQPKIVILEADQLHRNYLRAMISAWGYITYCFEKETICLDNLEALAPDLAVCSASVPEKLFRFVASARLINRKLPILILTDAPAIHDYVHANGFSPVLLLAENTNPSEIRKTISDNIHHRTEAEMVSDCPAFIGNSPEIIRIRKMIPELSRSPETILILGEAGVGKELLAKSIYFGSDWNNKPFLKVDASAICPAALKKSFNSKRKTLPPEDHFCGDLLSGVSAGTVFLFLDRVDLLPADLQGSLLRTIEEIGQHSFEYGSENSAAIRIIAATDTELEPMVAKGTFRKDLYYRLNVLSVTIPPLRSRREDIPLLADFFADKFCLKFGRGCFEMSAKVKTVLCGYHWPGNVGELENTVRDMVASGDEKKIVKILGGIGKSDKHRSIAEFFADFIDPDSSDFKKYKNKSNELSMKDICRIYKIRTEGELIKKALDFTDWNRKKTAKMLSISYKSLLNKIKVCELERS